MIAPIKCGLISEYVTSVTGLIPTLDKSWGLEWNWGVSSLKTKRMVFYLVIWSVVGKVMVLIDFIVSTSRKSKKQWKETHKKEVQHEDFPRGITHPNIALVQARLTVEFWWDPVHSCWYDRTCQVWPDQCIYGFGNGCNFWYLESRGSQNGMEESVVWRPREWFSI